MPPPEFVRPLLTSFGYRLDVEPGPPATCRATGDGETWTGSGATADEAVDKLLHAMFPSSMAWDLFLEALHGGAAPERDQTQRLPAAPKPVAPSSVRIDVVEPPPSVRVRADFEAAVPSIARSSPERMRLALLRRLCMARAAAPLSPESAAEAQAVAARVVELAKIFWCGSAPGLRGDARPVDVGAVRRGWIAPTTWAEAADTARRALEDVDDRGLRAGHDAFGWADTASLDPKPPNAEALLAEVNAELDVLLGPAGGAAEGVVPMRAKRLEATARRIRWLRDAIDPVAWAAAAGRVRRAVIDIGPDGEGAERLLDPSFRPPTTWAMLDRFAPIPQPSDDDEDDEDDDDEDDEPVASPASSSKVAPASAVAASSSKAAPATTAEPKAAPPEPPPPPAPSVKRTGPEPPPIKGSPGELAGWALRVLVQLDTPEFLVLARPVVPELRNLGEAGIPTHDRRIKRKWREVLRRLS